MLLLMDMLYRIRAVMVVAGVMDKLKLEQKV